VGTDQISNVRFGVEIYERRECLEKRFEEFCFVFLITLNMISHA